MVEAEAVVEAEARELSLMVLEVQPEMVDLVVVVVVVEQQAHLVQCEMVGGVEVQDLSLNALVALGEVGEVVVLQELQELHGQEEEEEVLVLQVLAARAAARVLKLGQVVYTLLQDLREFGSSWQEAVVAFSSPLWLGEQAVVPFYELIL